MNGEGKPAATGTNSWRGREFPGQERPPEKNLLGGDVEAQLDWTEKLPEG